MRNYPALSRVQIVWFCFAGVVWGSLLHRLTEQPNYENDVWFRFLAIAGIAFFVVSKERMFLRGAIVSVLVAAMLSFPIDWVPDLRSWERYTTPIGFIVLITAARAAVEGRKAWPDYELVWSSYLRLLSDVSLVALFVAIGYGLLWGWAQLLLTVNISVLAEAFEEKVTNFIVVGGLTGLAFGYVRQWYRLDRYLYLSVTSIGRFLSPIAAFFGLIYFFGYFFAGFDPLSDVKSITTVALAFSVTSILILTSTGPDAPLGQSKIFCVILFVLSVSILIYTVLAAFSLNMRITEYGFTPRRYTAFLFLSVLVIYAIWLFLAYGISLLGVTKRVTTLAKPLNQVFGFIVFATTLTVQLPGIGLNAVSAKSQMDLLASGSLEATDRRIEYIGYRLGQDGRGALKHLLEIPDDRFSEKAQKIEITAHASSQEYLSAVSAAQSYETLSKGELSIYEINLPSIRFRSGDYGVLILQRMLELNDSPQFELISFEAGRFLSMTDDNAESSAQWQRYAVGRRFLLNELTMDDRQLLLDLHCQLFTWPERRQDRLGRLGSSLKAESDLYSRLYRILYALEPPDRMPTGISLFLAADEFLQMLETLRNEIFLSDPDLSCLPSPGPELQL